jgi:hypothetical protein
LVQYQSNFLSWSTVGNDSISLSTDFKFLGKKYGYAWRDFKTGHHAKNNSLKDRQNSRDKFLNLPKINR